MIHNHPSGDPTPSDDDVLMTERVISACEAIDVSVHDHLIVGKHAEISFRNMGLI